MEDKIYSIKNKINIPPIVIVIISGLVILICLIGIFTIKRPNAEQDAFLKKSKSTTAVCHSMEERTNSAPSGMEKSYILNISFTLSEMNHVTEYKTTIIETDPSAESIDQGSEFQILYDPDNPYDCHIASAYNDHKVTYAVLWTIAVIALIVAGFNVVIIVRNKDGYTPRYEKPEDIGILGDPAVDNGLSDNSRDYGATDTFSNNVMDSYADPFQTYGSSGDEANENPVEGNYYDPNSFYSEDEQISPAVPFYGSEQADLNNPFISEINSDPSNPYNSGNYENYAQPVDTQQDNNSTSIFGDASFGAAPPGTDSLTYGNNDTGIYGDASFGAEKH